MNAGEGEARPRPTRPDSPTVVASADLSFATRGSTGTTATASALGFSAGGGDDTATGGGGGHISSPWGENIRWSEWARMELGV